MVQGVRLPMFSITSPHIHMSFKFRHQLYIHVTQIHKSTMHTVRYTEIVLLIQKLKPLDKNSNPPKH